MDMDRLTWMEMLAIEHVDRKYFSAVMEWDDIADTMADAQPSDEEVREAVADMVKNGMLDVVFTNQARALNKQVAKWREQTERDPVEDAMNQLTDTEEEILVEMVECYDNFPWSLKSMKEEFTDSLGRLPLDEGGTPMYGMEDVLDKYRRLGIVTEGEQFSITELGQKVSDMVLDIEETDAYFRMQRECRP